MPRTKWGSYFETHVISPPHLLEWYASHQVGQLFRDLIDLIILLLSLSSYAPQQVGQLFRDNLKYAIKFSSSKTYASHQVGQLFRDFYDVFHYSLISGRYASHQVGQLFRDLFWGGSFARSIKVCLAPSGAGISGLGVFCLTYAFHMPRTKWGSYFETWLTSPIFTQSKLLYASHQVGQLFRDACVIGSTLLCKLLFNMPRTKWGSYFETVSALIYYRSPWLWICLAPSGAVISRL